MVQFILRLATRGTSLFSDHIEKIDSGRARVHLEGQVYLVTEVGKLTLAELDLWPQANLRRKISQSQQIYFVLFYCSKTAKGELNFSKCYVVGRGRNFFLIIFTF